MPGALLTLAALQLCPSLDARLGAQEVVDDRVECPDCGLRTNVVTRLGEVEGPGALPGPPLDIATDARGRFWLLFEDGPPMVFSAGGEFVRSVGRTGEGPGEYGSPRVAVPVGDSVVVYDGRLRRMTVVGPDLSHVRTIVTGTLDYIYAIVPVSWPDAVVVNGVGWQEDLAGWPLHLVEVQGSIMERRSSFGLDGGTVGGTEFQQLQLLSRKLTSTDDGTVWAVDQYEKYRLGHWSSDGEVVEQLRRSAAWVPDGSTGNPGGWESAPQPYIDGLRRVDGRLWVLGRVASESWQEAWAGRDRPEGPGGLGPVPIESRPELHELYDTVVEIVDPGARSVFWRERLSSHVVEITEDGRLVTYGETDAGIPFIEVLAAELIEP